MSKRIISKFNRHNKIGDGFFAHHYDGVYKPFIQACVDRAAAHDGMKGKAGSREAKLAYDVKHGFQDAKGTWLIDGGGQSISHALKLSTISDAKRGKLAGNTLGTAYKNLMAAERAAKNANGGGKTDAEKKAAQQAATLTRMEKLADECGVSIISKAAKIGMSEKYLEAIAMPDGAERIAAAKKAADALTAAVLKDFGLKPASLAAPVKKAANG